MTDLDRAKSLLAGHSIALCRGEQTLVGDDRGISPMTGFIGEGKDLAGFSVADKIVGKAAALLFVCAGIEEVWAEVLSEAGAEVLRAHGIPYACENLVPHIVNRKGDGICPMETTVRDISDPARAYAALKEKLAQLRANG